MPSHWYMRAGGSGGQGREKGEWSRVEALVLMFTRDTHRNLAILRSPEFFPHHKEERCSRQWGTSNPGHPYIKVLTFGCVMW